MEIYAEQIVGVLFALSIAYMAIRDAGKLPAGAPRAAAPATKPRQYAETRPEVKQSPYNTTPEPENTGPLDLDAEEVTTIKRVNEIRDRLEKRRAQLSAMGLEITNLDKW